MTMCSHIATKSYNLSWLSFSESPNFTYHWNALTSKDLSLSFTRFLNIVYVILNYFQGLKISPFKMIWFTRKIFSAVLWSKVHDQFQNYPQISIACGRLKNFCTTILKDPEGMRQCERLKLLGFVYWQRVFRFSNTSFFYEHKFMSKFGSASISKSINLCPLSFIYEHKFMSTDYEYLVSP